MTIHQARKASSMENWRQKLAIIHNQDKHMNCPTRLNGIKHTSKMQNIDTAVNKNNKECLIRITYKENKWDCSVLSGIRVVDLESHRHLFFDCQYAALVWSEVRTKC